MPKATERDDDECNISFVSSVSVSFERGVFKDETSIVESATSSYVPRDARKVRFTDDEIESLLALVPLAEQRVLKTGDKLIVESLERIRGLLCQLT